MRHADDNSLTKTGVRRLDFIQLPQKLV